MTYSENCYRNAIRFFQSGNSKLAHKYLLKGDKNAALYGTSKNEEQLREQAYHLLNNALFSL